VQSAPDGDAGKFGATALDTDELANEVTKRMRVSLEEFITQNRSPPPARGPAAPVSLAQIGLSEARIGAAVEKSLEKWGVEWLMPRITAVRDDLRADVKAMRKIFETELVKQLATAKGYELPRPPQ
jgi:hypothetical protein